MSSSLAPLKTHRVGEMPVKSVEAQASSLRRGVEVRRSGCLLRCYPRHLTMAQNYELSAPHALMSSKSFKIN
ncbi:hypothetical protein TNCV_186561 [Trichonephila clavipes]|nr:hypothetical protein TNCV_186561 [Trichonephila clavipes]